MTDDIGGTANLAMTDDCRVGCAGTVFGEISSACTVVPIVTMEYLRKKVSSSSTPRNSPSPTPTSPIQILTKQVAKIRSKAKNPRALAVSSGSIALSIGSPPPDPSDTGVDEPGSSKESGWRTAYGAAKMAVEIANASSDMFLPLKAVVGALSVLIKNYDVSTEY